jgi:hypothetical protein
MGNIEKTNCTVSSTLLHVFCRAGSDAFLSDCVRFISLRLVKGSVKDTGVDIYSNKNGLQITVDSSF